jgi:FlaA1/EpsC-like NDP-sugar epimerase
MFKKDNQLKYYFNSLNFKFDIKDLNYLPRWLVMIIDLGFIAFSIFFTFLILFGLKMSYINESYIVYGPIIYLIVNSISFYIFKTFSGIIRYSSFIDAIKIFFSQIVTFFSILIINLFFLYISFEKIFLTTGLILNLIISFVFLLFYRIIVKEVFDKNLLSNLPKNLEPVAIYGTDSNAIAVASAILNETPRRYEIKGFITENKRNISKRILDLPIYYNNKRISITLRKINSKGLILTESNLASQKINEIIEDCINYNFKTYHLPKVVNWEDKSNISKNIKKIEFSDLLERNEIVLDKEKVSKELNNQTILVSGGAGSIGSEIVRQLLNFNPNKIIVLDQSESALYDLEMEINSISFDLDCTIDFIVSDVRQYNLLNEVFKKFKPTYVFHAAAYKHVPLMESHPDLAIHTNVIGTKNIADLSLKFEVKKFVLVSTDKAVNPSNIMGASKRIAELYLKQINLSNSKTKFIITRFGNVLGSNGSVVPLFKKQIEKGGPITLTHPDIIRYFMTISEACQLVLEAGVMGNGGEIFLFDMGQPVRIEDLAIKMIKLSGLRPNIDIKINHIGLRPGEKMYEELLVDYSKTLKTYNKKITIANEEKIIEDFENNFNDLINYAKELNSDKIVIQMKKIVKEFKSNNSKYSDYD